MTTHKQEEKKGGDKEQPQRPAPKTTPEVDPFATPEVSPAPNPESAPGGDKVG
jgi:hypothetical protein